MASRVTWLSGDRSNLLTVSHQEQWDTDGFVFELVEE